MARERASMAEPLTLDVTVRALAAGGAGVASLPDGRVLFVPRTAPGDRARVSVGQEKKRWASGTLVELLEKGPGRVEASCALYDACGGCQLQHLDYAEQLAWKGRFVHDALQRVGGLEGAPEPEVVPSPAQTGYRSRMSFTLRRLRGGRVVAGLHALGRPGHVVDVHGECVLPAPSLSAAWTTLRASWGPGARLLPDAGRLRLTLRSAAEGFELLVDGGRQGWDPSPLTSRCPGLNAVWHRPSGSQVATPSGINVDEGLGPAFVQVNAKAAELLHARVVGSAGSPGRAVDAYCGIGAYGRALADLGWKVVGIERDPEATRRAALAAPEGFDIVTGPTEDYLAEALPADLVVLNPPRTGVDARVVEQLLECPPARIVYVSCDPATLARDLRPLLDRYRLVEVTAFDLFPQTAHVESVAVLDLTEE